MRSCQGGGHSCELEPMTPFERKIVHDAVAAAGLKSESGATNPTVMWLLFRSSFARSCGPPFWESQLRLTDPWPPESPAAPRPTFALSWDSQTALTVMRFRAWTIGR